jgi:hypothetical protein
MALFPSGHIGIFLSHERSLDAARTIPPFGRRADFSTYGDWPCAGSWSKVWWDIAVRWVGPFPNGFDLSAAFEASLWDFAQVNIVEAGPPSNLPSC